MGRDDVDTLLNAEAGGVCRYQKTGQPARPRPLAGPRENSVDIGNAAIRDPGFLAIQHPAIAVLRGGGCEVGDVRTARRLRQRESGDCRSRHCPWQPLLLLGIAEQGHRSHAKPLHRKGEVGEGVMARQRLADQAKRAHVECRAIPVGRMFQPAIRAEPCDKALAGSVDIAVVNRQVGHAPGLELRCQQAVAVIKKRPVKKAAVRHQSPSKTGLSFATKAR